MTPEIAESFAYCRRLTRQTAENFRFSFLTLPREKYNAMCALYAFMRITDDIGDDETIPMNERAERLHIWRNEVTEALQGETASHVALPALVQVVRKHQIPPMYLFDVIEGVSRDLHPAAFHTFADLQDYCYHVAGAVGLCCIHIWGFRDPGAIPLAIDCGLALQLTNILRDIGEDAAAGRCYLPQEDLDRFRVSREELSAGRVDDRFRELMRFEISRARTYYDRARELFPLLEPCGRPILRVMLDVYGGLLTEIERRDYDVFHRRVRLPKWKKLWYVGRAMCCRT